MIPGLGEKWIPEVMGYFVESWGNRTRVDYGSGMELNFICWLLVTFSSLLHSSVLPLLGVCGETTDVLGQMDGRARQRVSKLLIKLVSLCPDIA